MQTRPEWEPPTSSTPQDASFQAPVPTVPWMSSSGSRSGSTRATSCQPCRKRKVKCVPSTSDGPYPCTRCVKMDIQCAVPNAEEESSNEVEALHKSLLKTMGRGFTKELDILPERAMGLLGFFTCLYRRRILTNLTPPDGLSAQHFRGIIGMILERRNESLEVYLSTLTPLIGPDLVVLDDRPLTNQGWRGQQLTPYVAGLFQESMATAGFFCLKGCCRWLTNRPFTDHWFTEEEAQELMDKQDILMPIILASILTPDERPRLETALREMMLEGQATSCEQTHICKVRLRKLGCTVMAMVKLRVQVLAGGEYTTICFGMCPLPMQVSANKRSAQGERRAALHVGQGSDPWVQCAQAFGDFEDPHPHLGPAIEGTLFGIEEARFPLYRQPREPIQCPTVMMDPGQPSTMPMWQSPHGAGPVVAFGPPPYPALAPGPTPSTSHVSAGGLGDFDREEVEILNQLLLER